MTEQKNTTITDPCNARHSKSPYSTPSLLIFGQVAILTRSFTGCNMGDNPACATTTSPMGNML